MQRILGIQLGLVLLPELCLLVQQQMGTQSATHNVLGDVPLSNTLLTRSNNPSFINCCCCLVVWLFVKGPAAGWIMAIAACAFAIVSAGTTIAFCVLRWRGDRNYDTI
jgi:hypothetical protein